jgi:phosphohistidine phosphatase
MEIYILRHGEADPREAGKPDADRKLTGKGKRDVRNVMTLARKAKVSPQWILTSPLLRAQETAAIAAAVLKVSPAGVTKNLIPSANPAAIWKEIRQNSEASSILLVGHEPHLSKTIAYLLGAPVSVNLKKSALVRIDFPNRSALPSGVLQWLITPQLIRSR